MDNAVQDIQWLAQRLSGLVELAPKLSELGSLDNAKTELTNAIDSLRKQVEEEQAKLLDAVSQKETALDEVKALIKDAKDEAKEIKAKAEEKAQGVLAQANSDAFSALRASTEAKDKLLDEVAALKQEVQVWKNNVSSAQSEFDRITKLIVDLKSKLS